MGAACVPSEEISPTFGGFDEGTVTVEDGNPACGSGVCLVNHFRGRVTCPYGGKSCTVPGGNAPVTADVEAQCTDRKAAFTVYCSCRCANVAGRTDDGAAYCACDQGYECAQLVASVGTNDRIGGGYCAKAFTTYDRSSACQASCTPASAGCGVADAGALPGPDASGTTSFITPFRPQNGSCLAQPLATDPSGRARCRVFEALAPGDGCAAHPALTDADASSAAAVRAAGRLDASNAVCMLPQLGAPCDSSNDPGWCYETAPAAPAGCAQALAFTHAFALPAGASAYLACP
jgi:hypothetical protein